MVRPLALLLALWACGDNRLPDGAPLVAGSDLVIVAHQDDDLYFLQPDLLERVRGDRGVTTVYVTAGNNGHGPDAAEPRDTGLLYAYGAAAGSADWRCGWISIAGHAAEHCRLADRAVSLVFLGYPDGGIEGQLANSLLDLWQGTIASADTVANRTTTYTQDGLIETLAAIVDTTQPATVRTLEIAATHGRDHTDHMIAGALALLAIARAHSQAELISYRAYSALDEATNKLPALLDATFGMLAYYEACNAHCASCGDACTQVAESHIAWLARRYAVGFRAFAAGRLRIADQCLTAELALGACDAAPAFRIRDGQLIAADGRCLGIDASGTVALAACTNEADQRFFLDDEGHLWSGVAPAPAADMAFAHLSCLAPTEAGGIEARLCGRDRAPVWEFAPRTTATARATLGLTATGRAVRLADLDGDGKADLCAVEQGRLRCAMGDGTGGFSPAVAIDGELSPLAVDPTSLTLGDIDGDHRADACGLDATGVACATAASGFAATHWSSTTGVPGSLAALDANGDGVADLCAFAATGVSCAMRTLSAWPDASATVWLADLDGDQRADWCAATVTGLACGVAAESGVTTDGGSWSFSLAGVVDADPAASYATLGFADIDGDGRSDACSPRDDRIACARSQGRGFGPRTTLAVLPAAGATALWLGDLDGDGRADACADLGRAIVCAVEP